MQPLRSTLALLLSLLAASCNSPTPPPHSLPAPPFSSDTNSASPEITALLQIQSPNFINDFNLPEGFTFQSLTPEQTDIYLRSSPSGTPASHYIRLDPQPLLLGKSLSFDFLPTPQSALTIPLRLTLTAQSDASGYRIRILSLTELPQTSSTTTTVQSFHLRGTLPVDATTTRYLLLSGPVLKTFQPKSRETSIILIFLAITPPRALEP